MKPGRYIWINFVSLLFRLFILQLFIFYIFTILYENVSISHCILQLWKSRWKIFIKLSFSFFHLKRFVYRYLENIFNSPSQLKNENLVTFIRFKNNYSNFWGEICYIVRAVQRVKRSLKKNLSTTLLLPFKVWGSNFLKMTRPKSRRPPSW